MTALRGAVVVVVMASMVPRRRTLGATRSPSTGRSASSAASRSLDEVERRADRGRPSRAVAAVSGRRRPEREVGLDRPVEPDVAAGRLGQVPLLLEHVAVRLDEVAARPDGAGDPGERRPVDVAQPALGGLVGSDRPAARATRARRAYSLRSLSSSRAWPSSARIRVRRSISRAWKRRVVTCIRSRTTAVRRVGSRSRSTE